MVVKLIMKFYDVIKWPLLSRLIVILIQILSANFITDHNADAFKIKLFNKNDSLDYWIKFSLDGFAKWDSMYFLFIAQKGYEFDQALAFFPLFPFIIKTLNSLFTHSSQYSLLLLIGVTLNQVFFVLSSLSLYHLSLVIFKNEKISLQVVKYYSFNPGSIFFSSFYSESLFAFLTFTSYYFIANSKPFLSSILIGLSSITRSNGLLSLGYVLFHHWSFFSIALTHSLIVVTFFISFQVFSYRKICTNQKLSQELNWCKSYLPLPYSYIQRSYWNLGLFKYWQFEKIPNFIISLPIFIISLYTIYGYYKSNQHQIQHLLFPFKSPTKRLVIWTNDHCFPFIVHLIFLLIIALLFIHIEVTTRLVCSSNPIIYWSIVSMSKHKQKFIKFYFAVYFLIGIVLHSNFYPWT